MQPRPHLRRLALPLVALGVLGALAIVQAGASPQERPAAARAATRPNIVFILTDDQDLLLNSMQYLPQTKALIAAQGMTFTQDFVPLSLCCPSRSTILTGLYPHNHRVYTNKAPDGGFGRFEALGHEQATIATALQAAGYRTALIGKYLNNYPNADDLTHLPPGWDEFDTPAAGSPYAEYNYTLNENGALVAHQAAPEDYLTDVLAAKAQSFLQESMASGQPFFLYFATYAPHNPSTPAPRHAALFPGLGAPRTPSFNEADVADKPNAIRRLPPLSTRSIAAIDALYRKRAQSLQAVDEAVAGLIATLKAAGQLDNTYIFFTSDNGYHMGQHRLQPGKYTPYETDVHMPLFVRGPGIVPGGSTSAPTSSVDFAPTLAALAGATLQVKTDGRSLVPLFQGATPVHWRRTVLLEQFKFSPQNHPPNNVLEPPDPQDGGVVEYPSHLGVRFPGYKYVEYGTGEKEVYDLNRDPDEINNLAPRLSPAFLGRLSSLARALGACDGASCRRLEEKAPPPLP